MQIRCAILRNHADSLESVRAYLPSNYRADVVERRQIPGLTLEAETILIHGTDVFGWTLDGYVLPRLASGLHFALEVDPDDDPNVLAFLGAWDRGEDPTWVEGAHPDLRAINALGMHRDMGGCDACRGDRS